ncbi:MAG: hypothetical protein AAF462_04665 [Thermodesulfobacteriota bacterium]
MLFDRKIDWSDSREEEWELIKQKVGDGIELPLPDSDRWFSATVVDEGILIESAKLNVRPLTVPQPVTIDFEEFKNVAEGYNVFLGFDARTMSDINATKEATPNLRYFFMLIYHLL